MGVYNIMTNHPFNFEFNSKDVHITMGLCRNDDVVYDDHLTCDTFIIDIW